MCRQTMTIWPLLLVLTLAPFAGCASEPEEEVATPVRRVDPRRASAEALCSHLNSLQRDLMEGRFQSVGDVFDLFYAETPTQKRILSMFDQIEAVVSVFEAASRKFGDSFDPGLATGFQQSFDEAQAEMESQGFTTEYTPARVTSHSGQRATIGVDDPEIGNVMQLVQIGDEWHISGYTFEHDPDFMEFFNTDGPIIEQLLSSVGRQARTIKGQLDSGQLDTEDQFGMAVMGAFFQIIAENPEAEGVFERLQDLSPFPEG